MCGDVSLKVQILAQLYYWLWQMILLLMPPPYTPPPPRWKYVDDFTLGEIVCSKSNNGSRLQKDLDQLGARCLQNYMRPKPEKCHIMHICNLNTKQKSDQYH